MTNLGTFRDAQRLFEGAASVVSPGAAANSSCLERLIGADGQLSPVNATRCSLVRRTPIRYMLGYSCRPLAI